MSDISRGLQDLGRGLQQIGTVAGRYGVANQRMKADRHLEEYLQGRSEILHELQKEISEDAFAASTQDPSRARHPVDLAGGNEPEFDVERWRAEYRNRMETFESDFFENNRVLFANRHLEEAAAQIKLEGEGLIPELYENVNRSMIPTNVAATARQIESRAEGWQKNVADITAYINSYVAPVDPAMASELLNEYSYRFRLNPLSEDVFKGRKPAEVLREEVRQAHEEGDKWLTEEDYQRLMSAITDEDVDWEGWVRSAQMSVDTVLGQVSREAIGQLYQSNGLDYEIPGNVIEDLNRSVLSDFVNGEGLQSSYTIETVGDESYSFNFRPELVQRLNRDSVLKYFNFELSDETHGLYSDIRTNIGDRVSKYIERNSGNAEAIRANYHSRIDSFLARGDTDGALEIARDGVRSSVLDIQELAEITEREEFIKNEPGLRIITDRLADSDLQEMAIQQYRQNLSMSAESSRSGSRDITSTSPFFAPLSAKEREDMANTIVGNLSQNEAARFLDFIDPTLAAEAINYATQSVSAGTKHFEPDDAMAEGFSAPVTVDIDMLTAGNSYMRNLAAAMDLDPNTYSELSGTEKTGLVRRERHEAGDGTVLYQVDRKYLESFMNGAPTQNGYSTPSMIDRFTTEDGDIDVDGIIGDVADHMGVEANAILDNESTEMTTVERREAKATILAAVQSWVYAKMATDPNQIGGPRLDPDHYVMTIDVTGRGGIAIRDTRFNIENGPLYRPVFAEGDMYWEKMVTYGPSAGVWRRWNPRDNRSP